MKFSVCSQKPAGPVVRPGKTLFYWFFCVLALSSGTWGGHGVVRLPLQHGEFATAKVGLPGRAMSLRLHATCNDTVLLFHAVGELETFSQTISVPPGGMEGSETFSLGAMTLSLPVRLTSSSSEDSSLSALWNYRAGFDGVLCLGPGSGLWEHWTGFAWGPGDLLLGHADTLLEDAAYMMQREAGKEFSVAVAGASQLSGFALAHGEPVGEGVVRFDLSQPLTLLPPDCFARLHQLAAERGGPKTLTDVEIAVYEPVEHAWYSFSLPGSLFSQRKRGYEMPLSTFAPNPPSGAGPAEFVLGRNMLGDFVLVGAPNGSLALLPSYKLLDHDRRHTVPTTIHDGSSLEAVSSICASTLVLLYLFVLADILAVPARRCAEPLAVATLACIAIIFWTYHAGFAQYRFFSHFIFLSGDERNTAYFWFSAWVAACCATVVLLWRAKGDLYMASNTALECALVYTIWYTQVDCISGGSVFELLALMFIVVMHTWVRNVSALNYPSVSTILAMVAANMFFVWINLVPILRRFWPASPHNDWTAAYIWWTLSPIASWFFFVNLVSTRAFATVSQQLEASK